MSSSILRLLLAALICSGMAPIATGAPIPYIFVKVADSSGSLNAFGNGTCSNDARQASFFSTFDSGGAGVFYADASNITTVASTTGSFSAFGGIPTINNNGVVAFLANVRASAGGGQGLFTGSGGATTTIVHS